MVAGSGGTAIAYVRAVEHTNQCPEAVVTSRSVAALILAASIAACNGDSATGPGSGSGNPTLFAQSITLSQFDDILTNGPARVEIKVIRGSLVAREVEVEEAEEMLDEEKIESRATAIDGAGSVTLALGGLVVTFDGGTRFEAENGQNLSMQEFVSRVQSALNAGQNPAIEAKRDPAATPQDPGDATFRADELELDDEADEDKIKINVDSDNLSDVAAPPPDAILRVLDLPIEIDVSNGRTELESEIDDSRDEVDFEGMVASVSGSTFTLANGTVVTLVDDTEVDECDDSDELCTLSQVETALAMGLLVEADGEGVVTGTAPLTITASKIEFEIEDDDDHLPGALEFDGAVTAVDVAGRTLTLASGTVVQVATDQIIDPQGDLLTLQAASDALGAGANVRAEGDAGLVDAGPPARLNALAIKIEDDR
jgi:hypothetical protein